MTPLLEPIEELAPSLPTLTLDAVTPGTTVCVAGLEASNPSLFRKLHAMGVIAGRMLTVIGRAPFGDPISISTLGYKLSLRLSEARSIRVQR